ncbi:MULTISPECIES: hypothetical protein [Burkholderia]|uniref:hypothetical protein n=1 Tax=Burkholderia TaxID=32008 RepID=UPI000752012C|nr:MULTISPECIES: hypothetical protein [Burkholderia]KVN55392.1 hypothetical protein WT13_23555 [Burkholderia anthina]MCA8104798.1 hypothetical protein [Burkholderia sp. AU36459]MDF3091476.1 hypothetical protein [Burkholderia semiarida]MDF3116295.1 hypothetical protein [Burkholderia semiarida]
MAYLQAQQIVARACAVAKCPGFIQQGGIYLNMVLEDLWLHRDLKINRVTEFITVQANNYGPFALPLNYLRPYDLFFQQNNLPYFLHPISTEEWDQEFKDPSIANYPYEFMTILYDETTAQTNQSAGQLFIYPQSSGQITLTHRYMVKQPDIATPETSTVIPWFPDQQYLIKATAVELMGETDDTRQEVWRAQCEAMLRTHLIMEGDEQQVVKSVRLDPRRFHTNRTLKPTKITD